MLLNINFTCNKYYTICFGNGKFQGKLDCIILDIPNLTLNHKGIIDFTIKECKVVFITKLQYTMCSNY